ncbi:nucleoprotein [avian paramyxovirus 5]|uniref:Nucleocapsid n=1 Tax=avian paramyxovirus 5 TaxID=2560315 RepID=D3X602_9MONO|nr:nucleoprotein [Avian metaavulavirus 5]ADD39001.1 nucleoprotein [Avian metaavulavirus 5]
MSSVFTDYDKLQEYLVTPCKKRVDGATGGLLRLNIPVCVTTSENPEERWALAIICLRWIVSDSATEAIKIGAILSLLSLHASNMKAHASLAARSSEAELTILEMENLDMQQQLIRFSARSGVPETRARQLFAMIDDINTSCRNGSPFLNPNIESDSPADMSDLLDMLHSIAAQIWVSAMKSMTAPDTAAESEARRIAKYAQQNRVTQQTMLQTYTRTELSRLIRKSLILRHFMIYEIRRATSMGSNTTKYYAMVGDAAAYFKNAGLASFFLTLRFGIGTKYPVLAMAALSSDLKKIQSLIRVYQQKGEEAPYMTFLEDPDTMSFAPGNYPLIYSYAMGVGSILEASVGKYQFARSFMNDTFYRLGVDTAQKHQGALDEQMANELQLTSEARQSVKELMASLDMSDHSPNQTAAPSFLANPNNPNPAPAPTGQQESRTSQPTPPSSGTIQPPAPADPPSTSHGLDI